jgi:hypothetical protein
VNALPPPVPPTSLSATTISDSRIDLAWTDNSSNETGFKIERKTGSGGTWSQIDTVSANSTSYPNTGLSSYTAYYYRVRSYNGNGDSAYSNEVSATTNASQPTSISFNPTSLPQGDCYTATVGNGANMTIDVQYRYDGGSVQPAPQWGTQNSSGQSSHCTGNSDPGNSGTVSN